MTALQILHAEDDAADAELVLQQLRHDGLEVDVVRVASHEDFLARLVAQDWDVVLSDHVMPNFASEAALDTLREIAPDVPLIVVSGKIDEEQAVAAMRHGADDYVFKDRLGRLGSAVVRVIANRHERTLRHKSDERFRLAVDNQLDVFVVHAAVRDTSGRIVDMRYEFVNRAFTELTGLTVQDVIGRGVLELFPGIEGNGIFAGLAHVVETGEPLSVDDAESDMLLHGERTSIFADIRIIKHGDGCVSQHARRHRTPPRARARAAPAAPVCDAHPRQRGDRHDKGP